MQAAAAKMRLIGGNENGVASAKWRGGVSGGNIGG
jgi:hypothetical protein